MPIVQCHTAAVLCAVLTNGGMLYSADNHGSRAKSCLMHKYLYKVWTWTAGNQDLLI